MSEVLHTVHQSRHKSVFAERAFWVRVWDHMKSELASSILVVRNVGGVVLATLLGIVLFLLEFKPVKDFATYVLAIPFSIYWAVKYLTILPMIFTIIFLVIKPKHAAITLSLISIFSFIWVLMM